MILHFEHSIPMKRKKTDKKHIACQSPKQWTLARAKWKTKRFIRKIRNFIEKEMQLLHDFLFQTGFPISNDDERKKEMKDNEKATRPNNL